MANNCIGIVRILSTAIDVEVVGVSKGKANLKLQKNVVLDSKQQVNSLPRDREGVIWSWVKKPADSTLHHPSIINDFIGNINIISTNYIFGVAHSSTNKKVGGCTAAPMEKQPNVPQKMFIITYAIFLGYLNLMRMIPGTGNPEHPNILPIQISLPHPFKISLIQNKYPLLMRPVVIHQT